MEGKNNKERNLFYFHFFTYSHTHTFTALLFKGEKFLLYPQLIAQEAFRDFSFPSDMCLDGSEKKIKRSRKRGRKQRYVVDFLFNLKAE